MAMNKGHLNGTRRLDVIYNRPNFKNVDRVNEDGCRPTLESQSRLRKHFAVTDKKDMGLSCLLLSLLTVIGLPTGFTAGPDWLVTKVTTPTTLNVSTNSLRLNNGLIFREFLLNPDFTTVDFFSVEKGSSLLRAVGPEAVVALDGVEYEVGGVITSIPRGYLDRVALAKNMTANPKAFHYVSHSTQKPRAPFPYKPKRSRGAPKDIVWPPKGLRLDVTFRAPFTAPLPHQEVKVIVHYEMYDGIPLLVKWLTVTTPSTWANFVQVSVPSVEYLAVNQQWADEGTFNDLGRSWPTRVLSQFFVENDQSHGTQVIWGIDPSKAVMPGSFEPIVNCTYRLQPNVFIAEGFDSFRVHELVIGSTDPERVGLAKHRLMRLLAPQTQENPIFFHLTNSSSAEMRAVVDQMSEVGFEMLIYSFGSGLRIESTDPVYLEKIAEDVAYARSKNIEVGAYDLIALTRRVKPEWMAVGSNGACFASGWYEHLLNQLLMVFNKTGMTMVETDGPYGGYSCSSTNHSHHMGHQDSIYRQQKLQGQFYSILQGLGIYTNQPDRFFYQGGSKTGMGYDEHQYSLPRWQDICISRQSVYDGTYHLIPTNGWMFLPLVDYHGGGAAAAFEPLNEHLLEYEWALAQYLGAGVAACYRGYRLYDTEATKQVVKKWVSFYKKYRDIITSDIVHVRRPDMQWLDSYMHVNPFLPTKGLAMVFNPTSNRITSLLTLPLYYTGLSDKAVLREQGGVGVSYQLDRQFNVQVKVDLPAYGITWFTIE